MLCKDVIIPKMDDKIYFLTKDLKNEMDNDPRFIRLNELNKKMNDDEEVILLAMKKDELNDKYNDLLRFCKDDDEVVVKARKELLQAKIELESHPLVKEYLEAYNEVKTLLLEVNDILFGDFKEKI